MGVGHRCTTGENKINPDTTETSMDVSQIRIIMIIWSSQNSSGHKAKTIKISSIHTYVIYKPVVVFLL